MLEWNDDWREELKRDDYEVWIRLADCRNTANDLRKIAKLMWKYNKSHSKEDCLDRTIEWITDWNNQVSLIPSDKEFNSILEYMGE